jgi:hypothetical protein
MPLPLLWPPTQSQAAPTPHPPKVLPRDLAEHRLFEAFDEDAPLPLLKVAPRDRAALQWLRNAIEQARPKNPFPKGSLAFREAEKLVKLLAAEPGTWSARIGALSPTMAGSHMALWRWGRLQVRSGRMAKPLRQEWEDRLLLAEMPGIRGLALRHALCWALAEGDEARFSSLKAGYSQEVPSLFSGVQKLYGWIGGTSPTFRLWKFPDLTYSDLRMDQLDATRIWICPAETDLPRLEPRTAWIIPAKAGRTHGKDTHPSKPDTAEALALAPRLKSEGLAPWLAPQRQEWEEAGLLFFPILIELDPEKRVRRIQMGDAAPPRP